MSENKGQSNAQLGVSQIVNQGCTVPTNAPLVGTSPATPVNQPSAPPAPPPKD